MGGERYIYTNTIRCAVQGGMGSRQVADFFWVRALGNLGRWQTVAAVRLSGRLTGTVEGCEAAPAGSLTGKRALP
jgi:hypothetical protein